MNHEERFERIERTLEWVAENHARFQTDMDRLTSRGRRIALALLRAIRRNEQAARRNEERLARLSTETDQRLARQRTETDQQLARQRAETDQWLARLSAETDRRFQATDARINALTALFERHLSDQAH